MEGEKKEIVDRLFDKVLSLLQQLRGVYRHEKQFKEIKLKADVLHYAVEYLDYDELPLSKIVDLVTELAVDSVWEHNTRHRENPAMQLQEQWLLDWVHAELKELVDYEHYKPKNYRY